MRTHTNLRHATSNPQLADVSCATVPFRYDYGLVSQCMLYVMLELT